jgi:hypothetical protein
MNKNMRNIRTVRCRLSRSRHNARLVISSGINNMSFSLLLLLLLSGGNGASIGNIINQLIRNPVQKYNSRMEAWTSIKKLIKNIETIG